MHRALSIPEILQIVCHHICPDPVCKPSEDATRDLARLARTCTTLSEPALDVLWSFQDTIIHILDTMPTDIWRKNRTLRRPIIQSDWERPLFYMFRVKFLTCSDFFFPTLRIDLSVVFQTLRLSLPTNQLFPNLRGLSWTFSTSSSLSLVPLLLAPGIRKVVLGNFRSIPDLTILATLVVKCPLLTRVRIIQEEIWETDQSLTISAFVRGLTSIKSLEVDHLDQAAFEHLSYLPHLATLTLGMPNFSRADGPASSAKPKFAALRELILNSARSQTVLACVRALSSCALESFNVVITPPPDTSSTMQIYVAVKKYLPSATLKTLRITSTRISAQQTFPIEPPAITVKTIKYLFRFNNLTFLSLSPPTGTDVDDDAVLSMAEAFPRLEHLSLSSRAKAHPLRATLRSLRYLAQHCPYLSYLEMSLNASDVPDIEYNVRSRIFNSSLEEWDVADSLIKSPLLVARFLSGIFPELTQISTSMQDKWVYDDGVADVLRNLWGEVAEALPICGDMREEERHWIMQDDCSCTYRQDSESDDGSVEL